MTDTRPLVFHSEDGKRALTVTTSGSDERAWVQVHLHAKEGDLNVKQTYELSPAEWGMLTGWLMALGARQRTL